MAGEFDLWARGKATDLVTNYLAQVLGALPAIVVPAAVHYDTLGIRALRADEYGRLLISLSTQDFHVINLACADTQGLVLTGAPIIRKSLFTTRNNPADLYFRMADQRLEGPVTVQPVLPFSIEGRFVDVFAVNTTAGLVALLQAVVMFDPQQIG